MIIFEQIGKKDILIRGRNPDGSRYEKLITDFRPYFYDDEKNKVYVAASGDVPTARAKFPYTYEADIHYPQRYIIDRCNIPLPDEPLRICYFDIETNGSLDMINTPEPIICIVAYDNILDKYVEFAWRKDQEPHEIKNTNWSRYVFNTEHTMLNKFFQFIQARDPDIISGFNIEGGINVDGYDLYYLINRCRKIGINPNKLSPFGIIKIEQQAGRVRIKGRIVFDLYRGYREIRKGGALPELPSYTLDYIVNHEFGLHKKEMDIATIWHDIDKLCEYCRYDVELCVKLDREKKLIDAFNKLRCDCGCTWNAVFYPILRGDALIVREANKRGQIMLTKREHTGEKYTGAFVLKTVPGLHEGVVLLDLKSLYPSIIQQFNISFDTIDTRGDIQLPNISYRSQPTGIIPAVIERLSQRRKKYKEKRDSFERHSPEWETYDILQFASKVNSNAVYGGYGSPKSRIYNRVSAESIPVMGREIIKWSIKVMEEQGYEVIYGDTDSIFVKMDAYSYPEIDGLLAKLNASYTEFVKKYGCIENKVLHMDFKGIYEGIVFTKAKKKYFGRLIHDENEPIKPELDITGFEIIRSDFNEYGKDIMQNVLEMILDKKSKEEIDQYLLEKKRGMQEIKDINLIAIPKTTQRDLNNYVQKGKQAFIRGAEFANRYLGTNFKAGSKMKFLYIKRIKINNTWVYSDVICYDNILPEVEIDWDKMVEITIDNKANRIYEAMGWGESSKGTDKTLGEYL